MAVPGFLLSGWAPARATAGVTTIAIRDLTSPGDGSLRKGVAFGMAEVSQAAQLTNAPVAFSRVEGEALPTPAGAAIEVVVSAVDHCQTREVDVTRIHTCPLRAWRPDAWSVASRPAEDRAWTPKASDWHPALTRSGAAQLNARFVKHAGVPMDDAAWRGWMAVKVAYEAALRAQSGEDDLLALEFDGYKGAPLRFAEDGHLRQPTFRVDANARLVVVPPAADADDLHA